MATLTTTPGYTFTTGETVEANDLNLLGSPTVAISNIVNADIGASAAIAHSKLANITAGQVLLGNASNVPTATALTGDVTVTSAGVTAIGSAKVAPAMLTGAQTGSAPIYGVRAWVNFDGTTADNLAGTYARTGTDVTVTITAHGVLVGHKVQLDFTGGAPMAAADGLYTVTVVDDANNFHVTTTATGTSSGGTVSLLRRQIRASGNVASVTYHNTIGVYTVNFSTALPDANYALAGFANWTSGNPAGFVGQNNTHAPTALACEVRVASTTTAAENNASYVNVMFIR